MSGVSGSPGLECPGAVGVEKIPTGEDLIAAGKWADCRICFEAFRRRRQTLRYCARCSNGFCEGEHGSFASGHGVCVICGVKKDYRNARREI